MIHFGVIIYVCNASLYLWVGVFFAIYFLFIHKSDIIVIVGFIGVYGECIERLGLDKLTDTSSFVKLVLVYMNISCYHKQTVANLIRIVHLYYKICITVFICHSKISTL